MPGPKLYTDFLPSICSGNTGRGKRGCGGDFVGDLVSIFQKSCLKTSDDPVSNLFLAFDSQPGFINLLSLFAQVKPSVAKDGGKPPAHNCIIINAL